MPGAVAAGPDDDLGSLVRVPDRQFTDPQVLGGLQGGSLSGGAAGHQGVHAGRNLPVDDLLQMARVNPARAVEGGHQGGHGAAEAWGWVHGFPAGGALPSNSSCSTWLKE